MEVHNEIMETLVYKVNLTGPRGTLWWHAHILWLRPLSMMPLSSSSSLEFLFSEPNMEQVIILSKIYYVFLAVKHFFLFGLFCDNLEEKQLIINVS